ncbi:glycosyltransferase family 4 protein [Microvirga guangxiensis]|uniref:Glycosyl transferases group 1 n=1 Tax=Microvirga guangxiensis TaxID=549386 RepID=A0A1G5CE65_9HYPH|nr:glycosyltransferase family 4 protein [Microvirga guangxiensis]SCY00789.1 Glycosyl transferases group 1 [Microvirga guangxiensis]
MVSLLPLLHRIWRLFPAQARRRVYEKATTAVSSKATWTEKTPREPAEPFIVAGALSAPTGLGEAARQLLYGLIAGGYRVSAIDLSKDLAQKSMIPLPDLPPPSTGPGTLLLAVQPPNVGHALTLIGRPMLADKLRIGCWVWDLEVLPESWIEQSRLVHALAGPSRFCTETFARHMDLPVRLLRYPIGIAQAPLAPRGKSGTLRFGAAMDLGSTAARKNPLAVLQAYRQAFRHGDAVTLSIKLRDVGADPAMFAQLQTLAATDGPPVEVLSGDFPPARMEEWWRGLDVFVSLHRSEGFGLLPAEAMLRGIPVISTDWSATAEYISLETGWPVPVTLVPVIDATGRYELAGARWAEPDLTAAVEAMKGAARNHEEVSRRGAASVEAAQRIFSLEQLQAGLGLEARIRQHVE